MGCSISSNDVQRVHVGERAVVPRKVFFGQSSEETISEKTEHSSQCGKFSSESEVSSQAKISGKDWNEKQKNIAKQKLGYPKVDVKDSEEMVQLKKKIKKYFQIQSIGKSSILQRRKQM